MATKKRKVQSPTIVACEFDDPPFSYVDETLKRKVCFNVRVRYVSGERERELRRDAIVNSNFELDLYLEKFADAVIVGWSDLTPTMWDAMVELENESERPQPDSDGFIPYSRVDAATLYAGCGDFQDSIYKAAKNALKAQAIRKNLIGSGSSAS